MSFFETKRYGRTEHGGTLNKGKRKEARPLSRKLWIHLSLKSKKAVGPLSFLTPKNRIYIQSLLKQKGRKFGVRIADIANVGNHLHLKIKISDRKEFAKFLKSVTTLIARKVTGARRGKPFGKFWEALAYTRVLKTRTEELNLHGYFYANRSEAEFGPEGRRRMLKAFNNWVYG